MVGDGCGIDPHGGIDMAGIGTVDGDRRHNDCLGLLSQPEVL